MSATSLATSESTELAYAGAAEQARRVTAGEVSAREVVEAALERVERLDPRLNAFRIVRAERALEEAGAQQRPHGPLAGVPVAIKDDTDVEGELTCAGTAANDRRATRDADVVALLRAAGAVVIGKTNVPELDSWGFTESMTFGATRNPWDLGRTPGGSSGGSAVAVATGMCGVAHGTDGTGSLRNPAAWTGIIGLRPGRGRIPGRAALSGWHDMVANGPMGRRVADVAAFMEAVTGDAFAAAVGGPARRLRIALTLKPPPGMGAKLDDDRRAAVLEAADLMRDLGHTVIERDPDLPRSTSLAIDARYFHGIAEDVECMAHPERLEGRTRSVARLGRMLKPALQRSGAISQAAAVALDDVHREADVLLFPGSAQGPGPIGEFHERGALVTGYKDTARVAFQPLWNLVDRPAAMLPWGFDRDGLPTAVQLGGRPGDEALLLALASEFEAARGWAQRRPPVDPLPED